MGKIEWAMWANEQAIASSAITVLGGVIAVAGMFPNWQFGVYGICAGIFLCILEYPRGKMKSGKTVERRFQRPLTRAVHCCGVVTRNYYIRFILYLLFCVPCCFILPTLLGGICLFITSCIYFVAAVKGEQWMPFGLDDSSDEGRQPKVSHPPSYPPPRTPDKRKRALEKVAENQL